MKREMAAFVLEKTIKFFENRLIAYGTLPLEFMHLSLETCRTEYIQFSEIETLNFKIN